MEDEPSGLNLSLDDIIKQTRGGENNGERRQHRHHRQGDYQQGRGGGSGPVRRGGGHRGRGRGDHYHDRRHDSGAPYRSPGNQPRKQIDYRQLQRCYTSDDGTVVVRYRSTEIVRINPAGDITLDSGGYFNEANIASMNDALNPIGIRITAPGGDVTSGQWSISDGKSLVRYADGVVLPGKGETQRGQQVLEAFQNPNRAVVAAATAASNAMASNAGLLPGFVHHPPPPPPLGFRRGGRGGGGHPRFAPY